jgi:hypothetical protein
MAPVIWITVSDPELPHVKAGLEEKIRRLRADLF